MWLQRDKRVLFAEAGVLELTLAVKAMRPDRNFGVIFLRTLSGCLKGSGAGETLRNKSHSIKLSIDTIES